ncbi:hypothetical protein CLV30_101152 [Haloactinopolyspora alba]|uniref:Uncharacterized protein n=1 Tax=Haloactinopolyspora alba TaxID=648780 RepID=A0A2P8EFE6_9ACTN|nr:hypothetical protein [Haloactinopolyspora alba]PSL08185.1 hypothetical protein CLV30_101152 [Haloactinopolyspora alba]
MSDSRSADGSVAGVERPDWWLARRAVDGDGEAASAVAILCDPLFADDWRVWSHVDDEHEAIDWAAILAEGTWSSGERVLLALGRNLWSGGRHTAIDLTDVLGLGDRFLGLALEAMQARRGRALLLPRHGVAGGGAS